MPCRDIHTTFSTDGLAPGVCEWMYSRPVFLAHQLPQLATSCSLCLWQTVHGNTMM